MERLERREAMMQEGTRRTRRPALFFVLLGLVAVLGLLPSASFSLQAQDKPPPLDPLLIRRVVLPADRIAAELEKAKRGALVQLPYKDFEARIQRALAAGEALKTPVRLVEARYMARLADAALEGNAEWKIINPGSGPGLLPVAPFNPALRRARWSDNRDVLLFEAQTKELGILVEAAGPGSLSLDWSARSVPVGGNLHFSLELPPAAVASLELDLPADRAVVVSRDAYLLSGPLPAADPQRRVWRIGFAGKTIVDFEIRRAQGSGSPAPLVLNYSPVKVMQSLLPGQLQADYDFDLRVLHGSVRELICECSPMLRPYEINIRNLEGWELRPSPAKGTPAILVIRLREPFQSGPLQVRCLAPLATGTPWIAPSVTLAGAITRGEQLQVRVHPDILLEDWQSGGFHITRSIYQSEGWQQALTLMAGLEAGPTPARPSARVMSPGPDFNTRQQTWWHIGHDHAALKSQITYEVARGRLFTLPLLVPAGWEVDQVELTPPELLRSWTATTDKTKAVTLTVDLQRPLSPAVPARLAVRLRAAQTLHVPSQGLVLPIPDVIPLGARVREGALAVSVSSRFQAAPQASVPAVPLELADGRTDGAKPPTLPAAKPPWGQQLPDLYYPFQGQAITGTVQLRTRPLQLRARCHSDVVIAFGRTILMSRLELIPEIGAPQSIDLFVTGLPAGEWEWKTVRGSNPITQTVRNQAAEIAPWLGSVGLRNGLATAAVLALPRQGSWWRLTFAQPLQDAVTLEASVDVNDERLPASPAGTVAVLGNHQVLSVLTSAVAGQHLAEQIGRERQWEVPLVTVPAADRMDGEITLHLAGPDLVQVSSAGLVEVVDGARHDLPERSGNLPGGGLALPPAASSWRSFRYGHLPLRLQLRGGLSSADRSSEALVERARLTTTLTTGTTQQHHFRFQVWNWQQGNLPVGLPVGATLQAVRTDGRWLQRLPRGGLVQDQFVYEVPVPMRSGSVWHTFELIWTTELSPWSVWSRLPAPEPQLPVRRVALRRTWRLPAGLTPLWDGACQRLPGSLDERQDEPFNQQLTLPFVAAGWPRLVREEQQVSDALAALRRLSRTGETRPLGKVLERLDLDYLKDQVIVVDREALRVAGIGPDTPLGPEVWERTGPTATSGGAEWSTPWETLDLVHVCTPAAVLITTRRQLTDWQAGGRSARPISAAVEAAIGEAAAFGHDRSGRFRNVPDWTQQAARTWVDAGRAEMPGEAAHGEWTEWEPLPGSAPSTSLVVVRRGIPPILGLVLAALLALAALRFGPTTERRRRRLILLWLVLGGLALFWLPGSLRDLALAPALVGIGVALFWELRPLRPLAAPLGLPVTGSGITLLVLVMASALHGQAPPAAAPSVYVIVAKDGSPEKGIVLAPPALLDQLQALERRGVAGLKGPVLLSAEYSGQADREQGVLKAQFQVVSFSDDEATLTIPLGGVQLTEALVDGAPTFARFQRLPRESYRLRIKGRGLHTVILQFNVLLANEGEERDLRFTIPELPQSRLTLSVSGPVSFLHVVEGRGTQQVGGAGAVRQLEADLGAIGQVRVRWRKDEAQPGQVAVSVQEAYYWHLRADSARLLAVLQYTVQQGWDTTFLVDLPPELEVQSVEATALPNGPPAPRLKEWQLRGRPNNRQLRLDFLHPVTQSVQVTLELVPRQPFGRAITLPLPTPVGVKQTQGFLAYRADGLRAEMTQHFGIDSIQEPTLTRVFTDSVAVPWRQARQEDLEAPTRAFQRFKGGYLQLSLRSLTAAPRCVQDVRWRVEPQQALLRATAKLTAAIPETASPLVEWEVPPALQVMEVTGAQVQYWTRSGNRLQIWLQRPTPATPETQLTLTGWLPRAQRDQAAFTLPCVRVLDTQKQTTTVRVGSGEGVVLAPGKVQNLVPYRVLGPDPGAAAQEWTYLTDQDVVYSGVFPTTSAVADADFRLLTFVEVQERELRLVASLDCNVKSGELRHLMVTVRGWDGGEIRLEAPDVARIRKQPFGSSGRAWLLDLKPGIHKRTQVTLIGRLPLGTTPAVHLPDIRVESAAAGPLRLERWLAVAGSELTAEGLSGLVPADPLTTLLKIWPGEAERLRKAGGTVWQVTADDWRLRLRPRTALTRSATLKLFLTEHAAVVGDGRQWLHQATYRLWHEAGADLSAILPAKAVLLGVAIDNVNVPPLQPNAERLWLPLPGGAGVRTVRLSWVFPPGSETFEQPNLTVPHLEGVPEAPAVWTVAIPTGYQEGRRLRNRPDDPKLAGAASVALTGADAQLRLLTLLLAQARDRSDSQLAAQCLAVQERFERRCREADYQLSNPAAATADTGPRGQTLSEWLKELRDRDAELTKSLVFERLRTEAKEAVQPASQPATETMPAPQLVLPLEQGRPAYWLAAGGDGPPVVRLLPESSQHNRHAITLSTLLLILLFAFWILARSFRVSAQPEQLALLGALGLVLFGTTWGLLFLILPAYWLGLRSLQFGRWVQARWPQRPLPEGSSIQVLPAPPG